MKPHPLPQIVKTAALAMAGLLFSLGQTAAVPTEDYEFLTRGPVHEAFAGTVAYDPEPGIIIDVAPPDAIEELPPEQQPEGENVVWIPGYWAWDEELGSFIWVSGIWRNLPPGREWVPGYWNPVTGDRFQWISGYWADTELTHVSYLPAPPRSIESGPSIAAPSTDHVWLPGNWIYQRNTYVWRSGYWATPRVNWVYVPATFIWTPRGYIFVDGYWDYAIPRRGVVFAPVYYHRPVYAVAGYYHTPRLVISLSFFSDHLFLRPSYRHYYFGDYYAPVYRTRGYYACHYYHNTRRGYDPVYAYQRWSHRDDRHWERSYHNRHENLRAREGARPPRTWAAMQGRPEYREPGRALAAPIEQYASNRTATDGQRFRNVDRSSREKIAAQTREVRNFGNERRRNEGRAGRSAQAPAGAMNVERTRSPIASRSRVPRSNTDIVSPETRTSARTTPPSAETPTQSPERARREADRRGRVPEQVSPPSTRPGSSQREARSERTRSSLSGTETQGAQPPQRQQTTPQRVQPPQRQEATPQRVQPLQRLQPTPQRVQPSQSLQPTPQRVQPSQRVQPPQRQEATPQRVQPSQRLQPTPQRVQPSQRVQPPQRQEATPQRVQPAPQREARFARPGREESPIENQRGNRRGR